MMGCSQAPEEARELLPGVYAQDFSVTEENDGLMEIKVPVKIERDGDGVVSVNYSVTNSNPTLSPVLATKGEADDVSSPADFIGVDGTLTFDANSDDTQYISVTIVNDAVYEAEEQFLVTLTQSKGANIQNATGIVSIVNDDPAPTASIGLVNPTDSKQLSEESEIKVPIKISLDKASEVDVVVGISRSVENSTSEETGVTAAYRIDYILLDENVVMQTASANVTIPAGESEKVFEFQAVDDGLKENEESVAFELVAVLDVKTVGGNSLDFSILDDDALPADKIARIPLNDTGVRGKFAGNIVDDPENDVDGYAAMTEEERAKEIEIRRAEFEAQMDHSFGLDTVNQNESGTNLPGFNFSKLKFNELTETLDVIADNVLPEIKGDGTRSIPWDCVKDNVTGLIWEVKTDGNIGLRASGRDIHWHDPDYSTNGGVPGVIGDYQCAATELSSCNTSFYAADINEAELCGLKGWRVPTIDELRSLVDYSSSSTVFDDAYFAGDRTGASTYWSSTTFAPDPSQVWTLNFYDLTDGQTSKNLFVNQKIRLVNDSQVNKVDLPLP